MLVLQGAREKVESLQFSPDGRTLVAPCKGAVQVWHDTTGGPPTGILPDQLVESIRFSPDGKKLIVTMRGRLLVHELATGEAEGVPPSDSGMRLAGDVTADSQYLVVAEDSRDEDRTGWLSCRPLNDLASRLWSVTLSRPVLTPPLVVVGGTQVVLFEGRPESIPFWYVTRHIRSGQVAAEVMATGHLYRRPVVSADGTLVAAQRGDRVAIFRADDFAAAPVLLRTGSRRQFTGLAFHPSGRYLAATSHDGTVRLYNTATWSVAAAFDWQIGRLRSVAFSPDGMRSAVGGNRGQIVVWDVDL
jgi:WD40 repeat protein